VVPGNPGYFWVASPGGGRAGGRSEEPHHVVVGFSFSMCSVCFNAVEMNGCQWMSVHRHAMEAKGRHVVDLKLHLAADQSAGRCCSLSRTSSRADNKIVKKET
jgi:hypothetical protein